MNNIYSYRSKKVAVGVTLLPPCTNICPAGEDVRQWIGLAKDKKFREAWEVITQNNPLPAIHGRVCYYYCETRCNRIYFDETVNIHSIERFLGDMAIAENWSAPACKAATGKKVLVVGGGPAGLSVSYYLRLMGHDVTIYEALPEAGGTMLVGIPAYRLPREVLSKEIARILNTGINIKYNTRVENVLEEKKKGNFDVVFLAIGAHLGKGVEIPVKNLSKVMYAIDYLRNVSLGKPPQLDSRLAIYGGGNTAIDVARTAKRLGVSEVTIIYHRTREKMSAFPHEIEDALSEGIKFVYLRSIVSFSDDTITLSVNKLDEKDHLCSVGETEEFKTDTLIFALSQIPDSKFLRSIPEMELNPNGTVIVDNFFMTGHMDIFAGGDLIPYERSVTIAVGQGRQAAYHIDAYLNDKVYSKPSHLELIHFDKLHIDSEKSKKIEQKMIAPDVRASSFDEIISGNTPDQILYETSRCFSCGSCFGCGKCYAICPVNVIDHSDLDGKVTNINAEGCIGCGKCFKVCPCGAISMVDRKQ